MMKASLNICAVVAGSIIFSSPAPAADLQTAVTAVTAFTGGAQVSRSGKVKLQVGEAQVTVRGLPPSLDERSVRVKAQGTATAKLRGVDVRRVFLPASGDPRVQKLEAEMEGVRKEIAVQESELTGLASRRAFLESIRVGYGERISKELGAAAPPRPAELGEMLKFVGENVEAVAAKSDNAGRRKRELEQRLDALRREVETLKSARVRETKEVEVTFDVSKEGDETVELSYLLPGASWEPAYDMRLADSGKEVEMTYRGMLRQKTGEDWDKVALTLSTAKPEAGGAPPELFPWRVEFERPQEFMMDRSVRMAAPAAAPQAKMQVQEVEEEALPETALVREEQTAVQFDLPKRETVPADGNPHGVTIAVQSFPATPEYFTIPKLSPQVFLKTEVVNEKGLPLLPGRANLFVGSTFVGNSFLQETAPGEKLALFFGADRAVKVKREELTRRREGGFFGKDRFSGSYKIEVTNFRKEPVTVTVLDQLPVPANEEIVVKLEESAPKAEQKPDTGELKWQLPLASGEKKTITFTFTVESPKGRPVEGL